MVQIVSLCGPLNKQQWQEILPLTGGTLEQNQAHVSGDPPASGQQRKGGGGGGW